MRTSKSLFAFSSVLALGCVVIFSPAPAMAYTACSSSGDCWHTDSKMSFSDVRLTYHDDQWADANKNDARYHWHEADTNHDWHQGYWKNGEWHHE